LSSFISSTIHVSSLVTVDVQSAEHFDCRLNHCPALLLDGDIEEECD